MRQSRLENFGFNKAGRVVMRDKSPVKALCVSCGRERWLKWVVDGRHLCDECKEFATK